jgi:rod shape-determining protein MreC
MAILENRVKHPQYISELVKFSLLLTKRFSFIFLIICSVYLLRHSGGAGSTQTNISTKLSAVTLELSGNLLAGALAIYDTTFKAVEALREQVHYFRNLEAENISLKLELTRLKSQQNHIESLQAENAYLRKLFNVVEEESYSFTTAKLLSISVHPFSQTAVIGAGSDHGVAVDQVVISNEGLVGRVIEVSDNYARIMLVSDANSRIPVVALSSRERGVMAGNNYNARMLYMQEPDSLKPGEMLVTSGDGKIYPPGIKVGKIIQVSSGDVIVQPAVDLRGAEFVQIYTTRISR